MTTIKWTGTNTKKIKEFVKEHMDANEIAYTPVPYLTFVARRGSMMSESLWKNIAYDDWPKSTTAAVFDHADGIYRPVQTGQWVCFEDGTFKVHDKEPDGSHRG